MEGVGHNAFGVLSQTEELFNACIVCHFVLIKILYPQTDLDYFCAAFSGNAVGKIQKILVVAAGIYQNIRFVYPGFSEYFFVIFAVKEQSWVKGLGYRLFGAVLDYSRAFLLAQRNAVEVTEEPCKFAAVAFLECISSGAGRVGKIVLPMHAVVISKEAFVKALGFFYVPDRVASADIPVEIKFIEIL